MTQASETYFQGMRILVAGASGFVGTNLVRRLVELGATVRGIIHHRPVQHLLKTVEYLKCDLTNYQDCISATRNVDFVFMAAAKSSGAAIIDESPLLHLTPNVVMNTYMLAAAYENKVRKFCFISSNTVYPISETAVSEEDANFEFFDKYFIVGWMKRFSEVMCEMYTEKIKMPMETVVVRPGNLYGPYDKYAWKESKVIAALIRRAVERHNPVLVWGNGLDIKDFLYVDDFVEGLLLAFQHSVGSYPLNIASGSSLTIKDVLNVILKATNYSSAPIVYDTSKPTMISKRMIEIRRINNLTGWMPQTCIEVGIKKTVDWYRHAYGTQTPEQTLL